MSDQENDLDIPQPVEVEEETQSSVDPIKLIDDEIIKLHSEREAFDRDLTQTHRDFMTSFNQKLAGLQAKRREAFAQAQLKQ